MANFFKASSKKSLNKVPINTHISRLDINGCGVAKWQNKPLFIQGALPNEVVEVKLFEQKNKFARAKLINIQQSSPDRVEAKCLHFGVCGGCDIQMLAFEQQFPFKQQKVTELFARSLSSAVNYSAVLPWQPTIVSEPWHYRRKARLGVQFNKKQEAIIGFRQKATNNLTAIKYCPVLVEPLSDIFVVLKSILAQLTVKEAIGHIEVIHADMENSDEKITLVIRQLKPLNKHDSNLWKREAQRQEWQVIIDTGGSQTSLSSADATINSLHYQLTGGSIDEPIPVSIKNRTKQLTKSGILKPITINFSTDDFIQINHAVNIKMIEQALAWLAIKSCDNILDLFCGLGNFSLAMANFAKQVTGVEGVQAMADKANQNAKMNEIDNCQFYQGNLNEHWLDQPWAKQNFDKVLLDPARAGAEEAVKQIAQLNIPIVLYVSCDPATLARDSHLLISQGYQLEKISLIDMFSQTKHVETMVLFTKNNC